MTCGLRETATKDIQSREERIVELLNRGVPFPQIAQIEGLDIHYATRLCRQIAKKHGISHTPNKRRSPNPPEGMTDASASFRTKLGTKLILLKNQFSTRELAKKTGLNARAQKRATDGSHHDWTISQLERLAGTLGISFKELVVSTLLKSEDAAMINQHLTRNQYGHR